MHIKTYSILKGGRKDLNLRKYQFKRHMEFLKLTRITRPLTLEVSKLSGLFIDTICTFCYPKDSQIS